MKKTILLLFFPALMTACMQDDGGQTEQTETEDAIAVAEESTGGYYGAEITGEGAVTAGDFLAQMEGEDTLQVKIIGTITDVCQKKGCWMNIDLGDEQEMKVRFKDYGFFVPKDAAGKTAIFEGFAYMDTLSVATLMHYAEEAGKALEEIEAITEPETAIAFEAFGVIINDEENK